MSIKKSMMVLALLVLPAGTAIASPGHNPDANICLRLQNISNTTTPNSRTILFHMRDGAIWRNTLRNSCSGLRYDGFVHNNFGPAEYCGNKEMIRAINSGQTCVLGDFSLERPARPKS